MPGTDGVAAITSRLREALRASLGLTVPLSVVDTGVLPRFEMKARRFLIGD